MIADLNVSPPLAFGIATYPPGATFGPRQMREWEFVWIIEGDARYSSGRQVIPAPQGSLILCRPGVTDGFRWDEKRPTRHAYFHFLLQSSPDSWPSLEAWPWTRQAAPDGILLPLFRFVLAWAGRDDAACRLAIAQMLSAWVSGHEQTREVASHALPDAVERALGWMRARLEEDSAAALSLAELAREACVSPEHLCRLFKTATGRTPVETVRLARLDRAATLLARTNAPIGEIALSCGFASAFHFSRRFKDAYGHSPAQLRAQIRAGATPPTPRLLRRVG